MAKSRITPEQRAQWAENKRQLTELMEYFEDRLRYLRERRERRERRLRRLTFGLLGR